MIRYLWVPNVAAPAAAVIPWTGSASTQPLGYPATVDRGTPLGARVVELWSGAQSTPIASSYIKGRINNAPPVVTPSGLGAIASLANAETGAEAFRPPFTMFARVKVNSVNTVPVVVAGWSGIGFDMSSTVKPRCAMPGGSGSITYLSSLSGASDCEYDMVWRSRSDTDHDFIVYNRTTGQSETRTVAIDLSAQTFPMSSARMGFSPRHAVSVFMVLRGAVTDPDLASLRANPWQVIKPKSGLLYFPAADNTPLLSDTFTDINNTLIVNHPPDSGGSWVAYPGGGATAGTIQSGRATPDAASAVAYYHSGTPPSADYAVTANLYVAGSAGSAAYINVRASASERTSYQATVGIGGFTLWRTKNGGLQTYLGVAALPATLGQTYAFRMEVTTSNNAVTIWVLADGVLVLQATDTDSRRITHAGHAGFYMDPVSDIAIDSIAVQPIIALTGAAAGVASAAGALTTQIPITGGAVSVATASGSITTAMPIAGAAAGGVNAAGDLSTQIKIDGAALNVALAAAGLSSAIALLGAAAAQAGASGALSGGNAIAGAAAGQASATGALSIQIALAGAPIATALASGTLTPNGLAGAAVASALASGAILTAIPIVGTAQAYVSAVGGLTTIIPLAGAAVAIDSATGALTVSIRLLGAAAVQALAGGDLTIQIALAGAALTQAAAAGLLTGGAPATVAPSRVLIFLDENRVKYLPRENRVTRVGAR